jgi:hypothetical protein
MSKPVVVYPQGPREQGPREQEPLHPRLQLVFEEFFSFVADKYQLDRNTVRNACVKGVGASAAPAVPLNKKDAALFEQAKEFVSNETPMGKLTVDKLKEMCRAKKLKVTGKKADLVQRLENPNEPENKAGNTTRKKKSLFKTRDLSKIVEKLRGPISRLAVRKNAEGQYVHLETHLVFDPRSQKAIGRWKDGQVKWLTKHDVEVCLKLGVAYELPENLDLGVVKVVDKKVEEVLGEDDFKDETDEEEEEEEEDGDGGDDY